MILTEDREYVLSLELEDRSSAAGLAHKMVEMEFSNKELLHAIVTCGMPLRRLTPAHMRTRSMELLYKIFLVETALESSGDRLQKSRRTAYLDSSEKSVISYYLGMFFTKLISRKLYGVDYLVHLNTVESMHGSGFLDYFNNEWRPDMIGYCAADDAWSVWEAKGGSNRRAQALDRGSWQAAAIAAVNGQKPSPSAVCMTYYDHGYLSAIVRKLGSGAEASGDGQITGNGAAAPGDEQAAGNGAEAPGDGQAAGNGTEKQGAVQTATDGTNEMMEFRNSGTEKGMEGRNAAVGTKERVELGTANFYEAYYRPLFETFQEMGMQLNGTDMEIRLPVPYTQEHCGAGRAREIRIGMPGSLMQAIASKKYGVLRDLAHIQESRYEDGRYAGADAIYVR